MMGGMTVTLTGEAARDRARVCEVPEHERVAWMAAGPDGTVGFGYDDDREPYVLPAIAEVG
jgi:hypothetical protein